MRTFSYTLSQKKQKKLKVVNTNRDPYLNHPTLISSNYNNASGIRIREYIELGNVSINFINYFNDFITNTGTQDLSNFFGIEIKSITINLKQLLHNLDDNINTNNIKNKLFFEEKLMMINENYKNNYNFIPSNEIKYIKISRDIEPFNIDKNYKKSLNSFILLDADKKINFSKDLLCDVNIITNNPINFLNQVTSEYYSLENNDDNKNNLLNSIELYPIEFKHMIVDEKNNKLNDKDNTYLINFNAELNNSYKMLVDINKKDDTINIINNYNFNIHEIKKNILLETINDENIINDVIEHEFNINIKKENVDELNFLKPINNNNKNDKQNINKNINFDFNLYNFDKLNFIDNTSNVYNENDKNNNVYNENDKNNNIYNSDNNNNNNDKNNNIYNNNDNNNDKNINKNINFDFNLYNFDKLNFIDNTSNVYNENDKNNNVYNENDKNNDNNNDNNDNNNDNNDNNNNIENNKNNKNDNKNNKNDNQNKINNISFLNNLKINNKLNMISMNNNNDNNIENNKNNKNDNQNKINNISFLNNLKINNKLNMISMNSENIKIYVKENEEKILFSTINKNVSIDMNNFIPKETINNKNIYKLPTNLELNIHIDEPEKFNNFLNNSFINTDDVLKEKQRELILNGLKITTKCIINVYQLVYNDNRIATGLGDFIRGSYFLIEFCKKYNFTYFIDFSNHPIKHFLRKYNKNQLNEKIKNIYKDINKFELDNFNPVIDNNKFINNYSNKEIYFNFLEYLSNSKKNNENIFIYTITFPNEGLINNYKKIMRNILEPTDKMNLLVNIKLKMLNLKQYFYEVIHVRCGDEYLSDKIINNEKINIDFILSDLNELNQNKKYLLISDNNYIKSFIKKKYNFINILYHDIVHTGETSEIILKKLENTMLDFYLISKSKNVMSYSVYKHGSGFSKWCAFTYDIPYYCKYFGKEL
jgi:hypothetical protein